MADWLVRLTRILRSKEDEELMKLVNNSWRTLKVVGRGTVTVDPQEVYNSPEFREGLKRLEALAERH